MLDPTLALYATSGATTVAVVFRSSIFRCNIILQYTVWGRNLSVLYSGRSFFKGYSVL